MIGTRPIHVLIASDHECVGEALALLLQRQGGICVIDQSGNGQEAAVLYSKHQPDVALMDLSSQMRCVAAIAAIRAEFPTARIVVLTTYDGDESIYQAFKAGAQGFVLKGRPHPELTEAIRTVHAGRDYLPAQIADKLAERVHKQALSSGTGRLPASP